MLLYATLASLVILSRILTLDLSSLTREPSLASLVDATLQAHFRAGVSSTRYFVVRVENGTLYNRCIESYMQSSCSTIFNNIVVNGAQNRGLHRGQELCGNRIAAEWYA